MAWRNYEISVDGFPPFVRGAVSRGRALADALSGFREPYPDTTFGEFLRKARVRLCAPPPDDGYDYVRDTYGVPVQLDQRVRLVNEGRLSGREGSVVYPGSGRNYVHVLLDGEARPSIVHPLSIEIVGAAP